MSNDCADTLDLVEVGRKGLNITPIDWPEGWQVDLHVENHCGDVFYKIRACFSRVCEMQYYPTDWFRSIAEAKMDLLSSFNEEGVVTPSSFKIPASASEKIAQICYAFRDDVLSEAIERAIAEA